MKLFVHESEKNIGNLIRYYLQEHLGHEVHLYTEENEALSVLLGASSFDRYIVSHWEKRDMLPFLKLIPKEKLMIITSCNEYFLQDSLHDYKLIYKPFYFKDLEYHLSKDITLTKRSSKFNLDDSTHLN